MIEEIRQLIASPDWKTLTPQQKYQALQTIDPDADVYTVSYCSAKTDGTRITNEDFPCLDEAAHRATALYEGADEGVYAGSYIDVNDLGGNNYVSIYAT